MSDTTACSAERHAPETSLADTEKSPPPLTLKSLKPRDPLRPCELAKANMPQPDYLVVLHLATAGKQGEDLGADEAPICLLSFLVHDIMHNKIISMEQHPVKPLVNPGQIASETAEEDGLASLAEDFHQETGLTEDVLQGANSLEHVVEEFDKFLRNKGIHPETGGKSFQLVMDGQYPMRLCFHPETCAKKILLKPFPYFYSFFDLRKEFIKFYQGVEKADSLKDMLNYLDMQEDSSAEYGIRKCHDMSRIISRLINDGHQFKEPEVVDEFYSPAIIRKTDLVDDEVVVRARGLPWQATDSDIQRFFRGLNIAPGGIGLVLSKVGRRNGEALVRFNNREHRDLALKRHRHHMAQRYIEVYRATGRDFVNVAGADTKEGEVFLEKLTEPHQTLVRMRGLPYTVTADQIMEFFINAGCPVQFGTDGILFVNHKDGRATGDAFVIFDNETVSERALQSHRQHIGNRYIELFKSTPAEVNQVLSSFKNPPPPETVNPATAPGILPFTPLPLIQSQTFSRMFLRLKGMPVDATVADILNFLENHSQNIVYQGVHLVYNHLGQPAGEALIQMASEPAAMAACEGKHKKLFYLPTGKRSQVDVTQCAPHEVPPNLTLSAAMNPQHISPPMAGGLQQALNRPILSPLAGALPPSMLQSSVAQNYGAGSTVIPVSRAQLQFSMPASPVGLMPYPYASSPQTQLPQTPTGTIYYQPAMINTIIAKGLPKDIDFHEIIRLFENVSNPHGILPDIKVALGPDGYPSGEAFVSFSTRAEAERAVQECNRQFVRSHFVELMMAQPGMISAI